MPALPTPAFCFSVYDDAHLCKRLVQELRSLYPDADIVAVRDGRIEGMDDWRQFCELNRVKHVATHSRLKLLRNGGLWLHRLLEFTLRETAAPWIIKTEGDTRFHRQFRHYPDADVAGTLSEQQPTFPRGGCVLFRREALQTLVRRGVLLDPKYNSVEYGYQRYGKWKYDQEPYNSEVLLCADKVLGDAIAQLNLTLSSWSEVDIQFRAEPEAGDFAATHPHRELATPPTLTC
jgi:hypothetical protein